MEIQCLAAVTATVWELVSTSACFSSGLPALKPRTHLAFSPCLPGKAAFVTASRKVLDHNDLPIHTVVTAGILFRTGFCRGNVGPQDAHGD